MSTKQLLLGIFGVGIFVVGMVSLLYAAYTMYKGYACNVEQTPSVVQSVSPSPNVTASPSAAISISPTVKTSPTAVPFRRNITLPTNTPAVSPAQ